MKKAIHVLHRDTDNKWVIKTAGKQRPARVVDTMGEAYAIGRRMAMNARSELIVHRSDGSIRSKDSFGVDPFPPK